MDDYNRMRHEREAGQKEGEAKGRKEGLAEGEAIGVTKGKAEGQANATKQIALKLLKDGLSMEKIEEYTGLSITDIQNLKLTK